MRSASGNRSLLAVACYAVLACALPAGAADEAHEKSTDESARHEHAHSGHSASHYHKNLVGAFVGLTHAGRRENAPALGLEYTHRFSQHFSIGAVAEYTGGDADLWVAAIPLGWHLGHWKLYVAPGVEDGHHGTEELLRVGAEYAFELSGGWEIAPQLNVDFVDGEDVWVFGVVFARGF